MKLKLLGALLLAALFGTGCEGPRTFGGIPREKLEIKTVSLSPSATEMLSTMGVTLKGKTKACNFPPMLVGVPIVGDLKPDYEALTSIKPDYIVFDGDLYSKEEVAKIEATGAKTVEIRATTVNDFIKEMFTVAALVGTEQNTASYVERIRAQKRTSEGDAPSPRPKSVMIIPGTNGSHYIAGVKSFQADLIRVLGGDAQGPDSTKFEPLKPEFLIGLDPDLIIVAGKTKDFMADTRFKGLRAVKELRLFGMEPDLLLRRGGRVDQVILQGHKALMLSIRAK